MKQSLFVLTLVFVALLTFAGPKTKTYPASCERVWSAVKRATSPPHYNFAMLDDAQKKGIISTGNNLTGKRSLDITLSGHWRKLYGGSRWNILGFSSQRQGRLV